MATVSLAPSSGGSSAVSGDDPSTATQGQSPTPYQPVGMPSSSTQGMSGVVYLAAAVAAVYFLFRRQ